MSNESVRCWGFNDHGQLGDGVGSDEPQSVAPVTVVGLHDAVQISVGARHACALRANHYAVCWGDNTFGQIGYPIGPDALVPLPVLGLGQARYVSAGYGHTCAIAMDRSVLCWGAGGGVGMSNSATASLIPTPVAGVGDVVALSAGGVATCAIAGAHRRVYCWGFDDDGQLGNGHVVSRNFPAGPVIGLSHMTAVDSGFNFTCATNPARVFCWGYNSNGELGNVTASLPTPTPQTARLVMRPASISAGEDTACASTTASTLYCWGSDGAGALGDGPTDSGGLVVQVP
jgi:alpha-tubulin suppressor-like RCC1 family protein